MKISGLINLHLNTAWLVGSDKYGPGAWVRPGGCRKPMARAITWSLLGSGHRKRSGIGVVG